MMFLSDSKELHRHCLYLFLCIASFTGLVSDGIVDLDVELARVVRARRRPQRPDDSRARFSQNRLLEDKERLLPVRRQALWARREADRLAGLVLLRVGSACDDCVALQVRQATHFGLAWAAHLDGRQPFELLSALHVALLARWRVWAAIGGEPGVKPARKRLDLDGLAGLCTGGRRVNLEAKGRLEAGLLRPHRVVREVEQRRRRGGNLVGLHTVCPRFINQALAHASQLKAVDVVPEGHALLDDIARRDSRQYHAGMRRRKDAVLCQVGVSRVEDRRQHGLVQEKVAHPLRHDEVDLSPVLGQLRVQLLDLAWCTLMMPCMPLRSTFSRARLATSEASMAMTWRAPARAANRLRMPLPQPTSITVLPRIRWAFAGERRNLA
ncbi:hypothetical protein L7F22_069084 [Adiantum nelumboides]|nr:hypothetical protein [Adiantum nelumboides]